MVVNTEICLFYVELPQRRERARTLSNEKLLEDRETPRYQRLLSDTAATTFTGMFRKGKREVLGLMTGSWYGSDMIYFIFH